MSINVITAIVSLKQAYLTSILHLTLALIKLAFTAVLYWFILNFIYKRIWYKKQEQKYIKVA